MVNLGKIMKIDFLGDGVWKEVGYWDGSNFEPIVEETPQVLMTFEQVFIDAAGMVETLLPDVAICGKSMGAPTHFTLLGQMFKIHAISNMGYVSSMELPDPKLWGAMDGLPMPLTNPIPHLCLDISGEDAIRFRQTVELHQAVESQKTKKGKKTWESLFAGTATVEPSHQGRALSLMSKVPALRERVACPCTCPISQGEYKVEDCIMHLNDVHHPRHEGNVEGWESWSRERIADWVDSLPFDFTVQPTPSGGRGSRAEFEALADYMKVDSPSAAMVDAMQKALPGFVEASAAMLAKVEEAVDEALVQQMVDMMKVPISFIINKEEDK